MDNLKALPTAVVKMLRPGINNFNDMSHPFFASALQQFRDYKALGEKTFAQLSDEQLFVEPVPGCNSIAIIVRHMSGNMKSRWTNFLEEDGEKSWRERDSEFTPPAVDRAGLLALWQEGWSVVFGALEPLGETDLQRVIHIRTRPLTVLEAVHRQLTHYASHVGQIILLGKMMKGEEWSSLSIPPGGSAAYNAQLGSKQA